MPHLLTDDEEDEWVTEVRQSAAGSVVIHNCFLLTLLTIEAPAPQWCKHSRPGAQQGADDTINEQTEPRAMQSVNVFYC